MPPTGTLKWKYETGDKMLGGANYAKNPERRRRSGCSSAATTRICTASTPPPARPSGRTATDNYINGTPALLPSGEIVFGGCDSFIHVLQLADGKEVRQIESEAYIASSVAVADGLGYVGNYGNIVIAFDPKSGRGEMEISRPEFPLLLLRGA